MSSPVAPAANAGWPHIVFAILMVPIGLFLLVGGVWLIALGGSWYYLATGLACLGSGYLLYRGRMLGIWLYTAMLLWTLMWSFLEVGLDFWGVFPRIAGPAVLGLWLALPMVWRPLLTRAAGTRAFAVAKRGRFSRPTRLAVLGSLAVVLAGAGVMVSRTLLAPSATDVHASGAVSTDRPAGLNTPDGAEVANPVPGADDWSDWGRTASGDRFIPFEQITTANVANLEIAWTYRTGGAGPNQATPLQINDTLYFCTRDNIVVALNAETGSERWQYNPVLGPLANGGGCRGVSFHRQDTTPADGQCQSRIITTTRDARLIAVDARDGRPCVGFGVDGEIDLRSGMGEDVLGYQHNTSPALVVGNVAVVGSAIHDGQSVDEPSGVIRAYNAVSGAFLWAWDMGRPGVNTEPGPGETYTRGTPNVWSLMSADPDLGMIYLPLGNATPDYYGGHRTPEMEKYASSVVALRVADGSVAWYFQTVHHDIWDLDVASQPVLIDFPTENGPVPAVLQATKRGQFFVFNRATGEPLIDVEERPVPQGAVEGDFTAPTQPYPSGMPHVAGERLREADMWGLTPLDQLMCRIVFKQSRYEGEFTPPSLQGSILYPGFFGGSNWGSVSIDTKRNIMLASSQRLAQLVTLYPRDHPIAAGIEATGPDGRPLIHQGEASPQHGVPYVATNGGFMSPIGVPCQRPPYGMMTAIDLDTRTVLWERPLGTTRNSGPFGLAIGLPLEMGVPVNGGSLVTASGLTFHAGSQDGYLRAFNTETGDEVWRSALPVGSQATPMSYISPESGEQFIVVTAGGAMGIAQTGDYVVAYRLRRS